MPIRAVHRQGWDDGIDSRAIRESGIHHGGGFIYTASNLRNNPIDYMLQVLIIFENRFGQFQFSIAFYIDLFMSID